MGIRKEISFVESFHHDRAFVTVDGHYRIIDTQGETVAELGFDQVNPQSPWCWQVTKVDQGTYRSGLIDLNGNLISELNYDYVGYYDSSVKRIHVCRNKRHGFFDELAREAVNLRAISFLPQSSSNRVLGPVEDRRSYSSSSLDR